MEYGVTGAIERTCWEKVANELDSQGYSIVPQFLPESLCDEMVALYDEHNIYRKTVVMERYRFGLGEYKYFDYPLPDFIATIRSQIYPKLVSIANTWMERLNIERNFPSSLEALTTECRSHDQCKPTPLILRYEKGGYNTLHQDLYGDVYFPIQCAIFLSQPNVDYEGGEFVLTQQVPRAQSKAIVLKPQKRDMIIFTTNFKPAKGVRGYYRVNVKHGVSEVHCGVRYAFGLIFHDAKT